MNATISFCGQTVRIHDDPEPSHIEAAIRHVLLRQPGTWRIVLGRKGSEWHIEMERCRDTQGTALRVAADIPSPLPPGFALRTQLNQAWHEQAGLSIEPEELLTGRPCNRPVAAVA